MNKAVAFLAKLGFWPFVILFTILTLIISELLVLLHSYWLTGEFFDKNLLIAGFFIPMIDGLIGFGLVAFLIRYLRELEEEKNTTIALQKETQEKLTISENYLRAILDSFPFFVWLKDTNGDYLATNKAVAKATGFQSPLEIVGKNDFDLFPKEMADSFRTDDQEIMNSLEKKELEEPIEGNGVRRWHQTYKAPILDNDGNLFGTVGFARDITKDKESEEELKLMKHALDNVREAVYLTNLEGGFVYVNDGATRQLGYT
ncbi:MAG: PAS domain S-box protein, partial [Sulfurimonas sp.]